MPHALTAALCATLLAGCGGTPQASDPPTPAPTLETSSTSATAPTPPATIKQGDAAGAKAFVKYWVAVLNYASTSGSTRELRKLATEDCVKCRDVADGIDKIYGDGGAIQGGGWSVVRTKSYGERQNRYFVDATIDSAPQKLVGPNGSAQTFDGAKARLRAFVLARVANEWRLAELDPSA